MVAHTRMEAVTPIASVASSSDRVNTGVYPNVELHVVLLSQTSIQVSMVRDVRSGRLLAESAREPGMEIQ